MLMTPNSAYDRAVSVHIDLAHLDVGALLATPSTMDQYSGRWGHQAAQKSSRTG